MSSHEICLSPRRDSVEKSDLYSVNIVTISLISVIEMIVYSGNNDDVPEKVNLTNPSQ